MRLSLGVSRLAIMERMATWSAPRTLVRALTTAPRWADGARREHARRSVAPARSDLERRIMMCAYRRVARVGAPAHAIRLGIQPPSNEALLPTGECAASIVVTRLSSTSTMLAVIAPGESTAGS